MPRFGDFEQYQNNSGDLLNAGKLYFYESGTTTPKTTYADINQTTPNTNPVILSAAGRQGNIWFDGIAKVVLTTSADVILQTLDPVGDTDVNNQFSAWIPIFSYPMYLIVLYEGVFYVSLTNNNLGNEPDTSPTDWQIADDFFLKSQTLVGANEVAVGDATTGLTGVDITAKGSLLVGTGSVPLALAVGSNGETIVADSTTPTGLKYVPVAAVNGWQLLSVVSASADSTVDVETGFSSTYDNYVIVANGVTLSGVDTIVARWKIGGVYLSASYISHLNGNPATSTTAAQLSILTNRRLGIAIECTLFDVNAATPKRGHCRASGVETTPSLDGELLDLYHGDAGVLSGMRIYCNGGATITGTFRLYGIVNS